MEVIDMLTNKQITEACIIEVNETIRNNYPQNSGYYQIWYDYSTGELWTTEHADGESWTEYNDKNIMLVCNTTGPMSPKRIRQELDNAIEIRRSIGWIK